jgi:glutamine cyclotransferase
MSAQRASLVILLTVLSLLAPLPGCADTPPPTAEPGEPASSPPAQVRHYTCEVVNVYPHDENAFTQGLLFHDGYLYESTGLRGRSSLRRVELESGEVLASTPLQDNHFGEGIALCRDRIMQLTWQSRVGLVYDLEGLTVVDSFTYESEGWGLTCDGMRLIMSDGSPRLYHRDAETFAVWSYVTVRDGATPVERLNELEFVNGMVYANVWRTDRIAIIDPTDGRVTGWIDLSGLLDTMQVTTQVDVLNGIAYDAAGDRLFVTGKLWPWLFEIRLVER